MTYFVEMNVTNIILTAVKVLAAKENEELAACQWVFGACSEKLFMLKLCAKFKVRYYGLEKL